MSDKDKLLLYIHQKILKYEHTTRDFIEATEVVELLEEIKIKIRRNI